jgi:putative ABC transport system substrate-binding protein
VAGPDPNLDAIFAALKQEHVDGLLVLEEPVLGVHAKRIAELAAKNGLPTLFSPSRAGAGALLSYGTSQTAGIRRMASYVDKILKGADPGKLPVETVNLYELIVNLDTARQIGVTVPDEVLERADRVIK